MGLHNSAQENRFKWRVGLAGGSPCAVSYVIRTHAKAYGNGTSGSADSSMATAPQGRLIQVALSDMLTPACYLVYYQHCRHQHPGAAVVHADGCSRAHAAAQVGTRPGDGQQRVGNGRDGGSGASCAFCAWQSARRQSAVAYQSASGTSSRAKHHGMSGSTCTQHLL
jgi:hypothetical protein